MRLNDQLYSNHIWKVATCNYDSVRHRTHPYRSTLTKRKQSSDNVINNVFNLLFCRMMSLPDLFRDLALNLSDEITYLCRLFRVSDIPIVGPFVSILYSCSFSYPLPVRILLLGTVLAFLSSHSSTPFPVVPE